MQLGGLASMVMRMGGQVGPWRSGHGLPDMLHHVGAALRYSGHHRAPLSMAAAWQVLPSAVRSTAHPLSAGTCLA